MRQQAGSALCATRAGELHRDLPGRDPRPAGDGRGGWRAHRPARERRARGDPRECQVRAPLPRHAPAHATHAWRIAGRRHSKRLQRTSPTCQALLGLNAGSQWQAAEPRTLGDHQRRRCGCGREVEVRGEAAIARLLEVGNVHRAVAAHNLNEHSSRSCARRAPACHGARPALLLRLGWHSKVGGLAGIAWQCCPSRTQGKRSHACAALHEGVCSFPGRLPTREWVAGTRSARCSWSSGASRPRRRRPAATASCAPSCTWWTWQARPPPASAWARSPAPSSPPSATTVLATGLLWLGLRKPSRQAGAHAGAGAACSGRE